MPCKWFLRTNQQVIADTCRDDRPWQGADPPAVVYVVEQKSAENRRFWMFKTPGRKARSFDKFFAAPHAAARARPSPI